MKTGGLSGKNLNSFLNINKEILRSLRYYNIKTNMLKILLRVPPKISQYIFLNKKKLKKKFNIIIDDKYEDEIYNKINIIQNIKKLNFSKTLSFLLWT